MYSLARYCSDWFETTLTQTGFLFSFLSFSSPYFLFSCFRTAKATVASQNTSFSRAAARWASSWQNSFPYSGNLASVSSVLLLQTSLLSSVFHSVQEISECWVGLAHPFYRVGSINKGKGGSFPKFAWRLPGILRGVGNRSHTFPDSANSRKHRP